MSTAKTAAYAALSVSAPLVPHSIERRAPRPSDVSIDVLHCGVCHSDLHQARNEWGGSVFPMVPGHEIVGKVRSVGAAVTKFKAGDVVGVGWLVDSCRTCEACTQGLENYCPDGTQTYNADDKISGGATYGGYSKLIVVDEAFVLLVPASLHSQLAAVAPLLCAGITTYSPLRHWKIGKGQSVGIVGLGGLGHMGIKFAAAFGARVVLITHSASKAAEGLRLGASEVLVSSDPAAMAKHAGSLHFILNTVAVEHDVAAYLSLLKVDGTLVQVGAPPTPLQIPAFSLIFGRKTVAGSLIGGLPETQEMLDFCGEHNIVSDIEVIKMTEINGAYERMLKSDVKYRFVIDIAGSL